MLRFIPLAALVAVAAIGCDQQPVAPVAADSDQAALMSAQPATVTTVPVSGTTDLCGYDMVDYEGTFQVVLRESIDETGTRRSHYLEPFRLRARGVGQTTGHTWIINRRSQYAANYIGEPVFDLAGEARTFNLVQKNHAVGLGQAPDFTGYFHGHLTINGDGKLVLFRVDFVDGCD